MIRLMRYSFLICLSLCFAGAGHAAAPVGDMPGQAAGLLSQAQSLAEEGYRQITKINEEGVEKSKAGDANCANNPDKTKEKKSMTAEVFQHMYDKVLDGDDDEVDDIIKPDKSYATNRENVKKTFYVKSNDDSGLTELGEKVNSVTSALGVDISQKGVSASDVNRVRETREEYASLVAAKNLKIAVDLREKVTNDLKSIGSAETKGCNQMHGHMYEVRGVGTLIKGTAADIVIQILTLESLGAKLILKDDPVFMKVPTDPNKDEKKGK